MDKGAKQRFAAAKSAVLQRKLIVDANQRHRGRRKTAKQWEREQLPPSLVS